MLKALELHGFKSFCDKTRFEFPPGITVVVGPNGSGKSNIVDAIKWVLGEQSAKSLRGAAMSDVIFKGTGGKRRPASSAEATIIFDNSERRIDFDADEVHVTRRVYRSGEGEYLINNQACRLRDIKDLFRGTGVGTDAYSLIEQGKVDSLLQASPKDRRAIFEEAAGISRFKAKKVEAQRRLERVDQNLLRLSDIVDEVDSRLRRLKSQASKARRYKEHTERLKSLRTQVGRVDWQRLAGDLTAVSAQLTALQADMAHATDELQSEQTRLRQIDEELVQVENNLRKVEAEASQNREALAGNESLISAERSTLIELDDQLARQRSQMLGLSSRAGDLKTQLQEALAHLEAAEEQHAKKCAQLAEQRKQLQIASEQLQTAKANAEAKRSDYVTNVRNAADLGNQITAQQSQLEANEARTSKSQQEIERLTATANKAETKRADLAARHADLQVKLKAAREELAARTTTLDHQSQQAEQLRQDQLRLSERRVAVTERMSVLEEIEQRMEGIESGVREVLELARSADSTFFAGVRGMVADLIQVTDREKAEMLEVALGERAQDLVVAGSQLFDALETSQAEFSGRVGFMRLHSSAPPRLGPAVDLNGQSGIIGRAEDFVTSATEYQHLVQWLLRDTWFVETLTDAMQYSRSVSSPLRFVTTDGQLVDRDGRLVVGQGKAGVGLLSRRAELRELQSELSKLEQELSQHELKISRLSSAMEQDQAEAEQLDQRVAQLKESEAERRVKLEAAVERLSECSQQLASANSDQQQVQEDTSSLVAQLSTQRRQLTALEDLVRTLESSLSTYRVELHDLEAATESCQKTTTEWEVAVAKSEQRLEALRSQQDQLQRDQHERQQTLENAREQTARFASRRATTELRILNATAETAEQYLKNEAYQQQHQAAATQANELRELRTTTNSTLDQLRNLQRTIEQQQHSCELSAEKIRHERQVLADRLEEDYGITKALLKQTPTDQELAEREEVDVEIADLRRKITNLGTVNMDALEELNELETRHSTLGDQYRDLVDAKEKLERIIHKINADSRRLFTETLDAIRDNFRVLFRKLFGGGNADIVLEEDIDILESGIDIMATPPGKRSLGLSLLSGGERALTAVALLMAIFEYRPSPFCVLDEVDGPLDEANIGRFVGVLEEFLRWTKFVVVTHSKKTMTCANTLYGVTMQESGISKRVSVRFEDVNEHGEISDEAVARSERESAGPNDDERGAA